MLTERQMLILRLIIQHYTESLEPIGSNTLIKVAGLPYSSATIRNEMMRLEDLGFLEKYHTSSGRVPSNQGYRYYLDNILPLQPSHLPQQVREHIKAKFQNPTFEMQELFHLSADILATLTNYTSISLGPELSSSHLTGFRLVRLNDQQLMVILVTDTGHVENKVFSISKEVGDDELHQIVTVMNNELVGLPLPQVVQKLQYELPNLIQKYFRSQLHVISAMNQILQKFEQDRLHVSGKRNLLNYLDTHSNVSQLKDIYRLMDDSHVINQLVATQESGVKIRLGSEMNNPILKDYSLITASYETPSLEKGFIALLGPVNMPYSKVISIVNGLQTELSKTMFDYYKNRKE
ncbi:heat-inducible transcriptional repressor HrcA [Granulicatella seriolae]|uniref:Heat-inducible transcription repressor HrcA n=1 Tax=Granulicatella seriolae TaxID=2967226 RepID=A0ABT1WK41_9LACT|nr:heat-inducible transcriptional repressor HrcA [Granulicatella seriolae]